MGLRLVHRELQCLYRVKNKNKVSRTAVEGSDLFPKLNTFRITLLIL